MSPKEPPLIAYLRSKAIGPEHELAATIQGKGAIRLGVRPRVLATNGDGTKVYGLSRSQVRAVVANWDAHKERPLS
jgi:hypothetical protein